MSKTEIQELKIGTAVVHCAHARNTLQMARMQPIGDNTREDLLNQCAAAIAAVAVFLGEAHEEARARATRLKGGDEE